MEKGTNKVVAEVISKDRRVFEAPNILPGEYTLTAKHPTWKFVETSFPFTISKDVTRIDKQVEVRGYDISGRVESEGEPVRGVIFVLLSDLISKQDISDCDQSPVTGFKVSAKKQQLCHVRSGQDGVFTFPSVPAGDYTMVPFYQGEHITFDVLPTSLDVTVSLESLQVPTTFKVEGFSVTGRVLSSLEGSGIGDVTISVQGRKDVNTKADGTYKLEKIKSGTYTLVASSKHVVFQPATVKITPNTPRLPDIVAIKFSVCGKVEVDTKSGISLSKRRVLLNPSKQGNVEAVSMSTDSHGKCCFQVTPGEYVLTPVITDAETKKGLKIIPDSQSLIVNVTPMLGITFTQFKAQVTGTVTCIGKCGKSEIRLVPFESSSGGTKTVKIYQDSKKATFQLKNVLPGKYHATIIRDQWCWDKESVDVVVTDQDVSGIAFKQTGYQMLCESTHPATLKYKHHKSSEDGDVVYLKMGTKSICLAKRGIYTLTVESCHQFEKSRYTFDTSSSSPVSLIAVKHRVLERITAIVAATDIKVKVRSRESDDEVTVTPKLISPVLEEEKPATNDTKPEIPAGPFIYEFAYFSSNGDTLTFRPISSQILFYPARTEVTVKVGEACPGVITKFEGRPGKFISGIIDPPLEGVSITLTQISTGESDEEIDPSNFAGLFNPEPIKVLTNNEGHYRVGPLPDTAEYTISAAFEGYAFSQSPDNPTHFKAKKLCEITIKVTDDNGSPLSGVLLSLSGGSFRSNNLTEASGKLFFNKLEPHQYFLRSLMKEFEFTPKTQMIDVVEGASVLIEVKGHRVAFSCYGQVTALNGEPEPGVALEAIGASDCGQFVEEGVSDIDGKFRIRGLQPNCDYKIQLKKSEVNDHISRATPSTQTIQVMDDIIENVNIIVFRKMKQFDLSGNVVVDNEFLSTLKVKLFREDNPDNPVHTVSLGSSSFFYFPSLTKDDTRYQIRLETSLSKSTHSYILPEVSFTTEDGYYRHVTLLFTSERKSVEQEIAQGSYLALPLLLAIVIIVFNHNKILPLVLEKIQEFVKNTLKPTSQSSPAAPSLPVPPPPIDMSVFAPEDSLRQKKKIKVRKA